MPVRGTAFDNGVVGLVARGTARLKVIPPR